MIRINLLATGPRGKAVAGEWDLRVQAGGMLALVMLAIGTCVVWNGMLNSEIEVILKRKRSCSKTKPELSPSWKNPEEGQFVRWIM